MSDVAISSTVHVFAVAGSLRKESWNRKRLRAAMELAPPGIAERLRALADSIHKLRAR